MAWDPTGQRLAIIFSGKTDDVIVCGDVIIASSVWV